ncbi:MAG TPA: magnesium/cobalt efflux protein [Gammaproteobacteria bacterium]|nr:magnesium/cobalt efflux protein [Gammaproteobacteria bacterium]
MNHYTLWRSWGTSVGRKLIGDNMERDELIDMLRLAAGRHVIGHDALDMIEGVFQVSEMQVRDIMVPRSQMVVLERDVSPDEFLPVMNEHGYSRYPVISSDRDNVIGILLAKDLLRYFDRRQRERFVLKDTLREVVYIPESKRLNVLLADFRSKRNHMAIVMNEYGGVAGLVTIEDVLEQIVGEIQDEYDYDEDESMIRKVRDGHVVKAITPLDEFNSYFSSSLGHRDVETIGGVVSNAFGHLPDRGENIAVSGFLFKVLHSDSRRVNLLQVEHIDHNPPAVSKTE